MLDSLLKKYQRQQIKRYQKSAANAQVDRTRKMPHYDIDAPQPGPETYSINAADVKISLKQKGSATQATVDLQKQNVFDRGSFLRDRLPADYEELSFHHIQKDRNRSTLNPRPQLGFDKQSDRDSTSYLKEVYNYMNNQRKQKEDDRIAYNHRLTMRSIEVDRILALYGKYSTLLPTELKHLGADKSYKNGNQVHALKPEIVAINRKLQREGKKFRRDVHKRIYEMQLNLFSGE